MWNLRVFFQGNLGANKSFYALYSLRMWSRRRITENLKEKKETVILHQGYIHHFDSFILEQKGKCVGNSHLREMKEPHLQSVRFVCRLEEWANAEARSYIVFMLLRVMPAFLNVPVFESSNLPWCCGWFILIWCQYLSQYIESRLYGDRLVMNCRGHGSG